MQLEEQIRDSIKTSDNWMVAAENIIQILPDKEKKTLWYVLMKSMMIAEEYGIVRTGNNITKHIDNLMSGATIKLGGTTDER
jgi:hypothetical protein